MQNFEKLEVWQNTRIFIKRIYELTRKFPEDERYGLTSQLRRAAISISSNIAEGSGRISPKDQKHFFTMAFGSTNEVLSQLILANDLGFISTGALNECRSNIKIISGQLTKLSAHAEERMQTNHPPIP